MAEGLNIATHTGEGSAYVMDWSEFNGKLNSIYQQDMMNQKFLQQKQQEAGIKLAEAQAGVRPADQPELQNLYSQWKEAAITLQSPKIRNNAAERAAWTQKQQDAYVKFISLSERSKGFLKKQDDIMKQMTTKQGVGYKPAAELENLFLMRDKMTVDQAEYEHYDTGLPYLLPASTFPKQDYDKLIYGAAKMSKRVGKRDILDPETGKIKGVQKTSDEYYPVWDPANKDSSAWIIANNVTSVASQMPSVAAKFKVDYETAMQNNPDGLRQTIQEAGSILGDNFKNQPDGYMKYSIAQHVVQGKPKNTDEGGIIYDKEWEADRNLKNRLLLQRKAADFRRSNILLGHSLRMQAKAAGGGDGSARIDTDLMYQASRNPNQQFEIGKDAKGQKVYTSGYDIVKSYQSAIASDNPSKVNAIVLNSRTLNDASQREGLLATLFPEAPNMNQQIANLTINNPQMATDMIVSAINKKFQQNISTDDVNRYAIPVYVKKSLTADANGNDKIVVTPSFTNPRLRDYGQFHADVSQQSATKKGKNAVHNQNENYMDILLHAEEND